MRKVSACCCLLLAVCIASAQRLKTFRINPGEKVSWAIPFDDQYDQPAFQAGKVYFRNERVGEALLNFNSLYGDMQFIDANHDTISLAEEPTFKYVVAGKDTFYFQKGFLKLVGGAGKTRLAQKEFFRFVNKQKLGGMGETTSASVDTYEAVSTASYFKQLVAKELITLAKERSYYIGDAFGNFKPLNKKSLQQFYGKKHDKLKTYLDQHNPDLSDSGQLLELIRYMEQD